MISWSSGPTLGGAEAGAVAAVAGVRASVVSGGALCVAGTALLVLALPRLWAYDPARMAPDALPLRGHGAAPARP
jgi:hypothetical protein